MGVLGRKAPQQSDAEHRFRGDADELRVTIQSLQRALADVLEAADVSAEREREVAVERAVKASTRLLERKKDELDRHFASLTDRMDEDAKLKSRFAGHLAEIRDLVDEARAEWPRDSSFSPSAANARVAASTADAALDSAVLQTALVTLPYRVEEQLENRWIGSTLRIVDTFERELPQDDVRRQQLVEHLDRAQTAIQGQVDAEQGVIYKTSPHLSVWITTCLAPLLAIAAAVGLLLLLGQFDEFGLADTSQWADKWHLASSRALLGTFIFALAGALLHLGVEAVKSRPFNRRREIYPIYSGLVWLHLRWASLAFSVVPILIVVIGLHVVNKADSLTALFAGYGSDSIAGIFLTRVGAVAAAGSAALADDLRKRSAKPKSPS
jgi:hypothetical protein